MDTTTEWIKWNGGECPVESTTQVQIQFRCESRPEPETVAAGKFRWSRLGWMDDIVAYRIIEPDVSERLRADDQEHRRIHHKGKGCDRCKAADAIDALSDALAQIGAETDTVADFEGIRFRNFALARLRGEAANLWDTPATLSPPLPSLEVERLASQLEGYARAYDKLHRDIAADFRLAAQIVRQSVLSAIPPLEDRL